MTSKPFCIHHVGLRLGAVAIAATLASCSTNAPQSQENASFAGSSITAAPAAIPSPATPSPAAVPPSGTRIATIAEIHKQPVFVRLLQRPQEQSAQQGMGLQIGETIRTQGQALAQVDLKNGLAFRIGGDAVLTLKPNSRLNLTAGDMITWVEPGRKVPSEIVTPAAVAGIRGTTVYVKIPKNPKEGTLFFAWEGLVSVRLPGQKEEILLRTAEEVRIRPGERDIKAIRQRIRRLPRQEWRQKRKSDRFLHAFTTPLPTLPIIERIKPGQIQPENPGVAKQTDQLKRQKPQN